MLFDLRSRGRRRTVRVVYGLLAVVMVVGLVGLGVGTGNTGGILNAGDNSSSSSGGNAIADAALKKALNAVKKNPSTDNWTALMAARWSDANSGSNFNSTSGYTASGKKQLQAGADAWQSYLKIAKQNDSHYQTNAIFAAEIYQNLLQFAAETTAWNVAAQSSAGQAELKPYLCLAYSAYAAKQTAKGDLAAAKAVALSPKPSKATTKAGLKSASTSSTEAESGLATNC